MTAPASVTVLVEIGRSLRESFGMFWETLWPLVLGLSLSGFVQSFVSRRTIERRLGNHKSRAVVSASLFGAASSSCSYAAAALARSLVAKGADLTAATVFMFASTNLVIELSVVLLVLLGWQFVVGQVLGGIVMIVALAVVGGSLLNRRAAPKDAGGAGTKDPTHAPNVAGEPGTVVRLRSAEAWENAATYTVSDLSMLRRELVIGYLVAGALTTLVPDRAWESLFFRGHGIWTILENVVVGPLVAVASFVCSVGNVPLAAALWHGGIAFGGVIAFLFADLITFPLLLVYRRYYGTRGMLRMLAVFWPLMSLAGLVMGLALGPLVHAGPAHSTPMSAGVVRSDATTWLDIAALVLLAAVFAVHRSRSRAGASSERVRDPVCGMQVERAIAPASTSHDGHRWYFCSERCRQRFEETLEPDGDPTGTRTIPTVRYETPHPGVPTAVETSRCDLGRSVGARAGPASLTGRPGVVVPTEHDRGPLGMVAVEDDRERSVVGGLGPLRDHDHVLVTCSVDGVGQADHRLPEYVTAGGGGKAPDRRVRDSLLRIVGRVGRR